MSASPPTADIKRQERYVAPQFTPIRIVTNSAIRETVRRKNATRRSDSGEPVKCRRQRLAHELTEIQHLAALRDVRKQNLDEGMLAVERGASPVFRARNSLN